MPLLQHEKDLILAQLKDMDALLTSARTIAMTGDRDLYRSLESLTMPLFYVRQAAERRYAPDCTCQGTLIPTHCPVHNP